MTISRIYTDSICTLPLNQVSLDMICNSKEFVGCEQLQSNTASITENHIERRQLRSLFKKFLDEVLTEREQLIVKRLFFQGASQPEVAKEIGISQPMVSKILSGVKAKGQIYLHDLAPIYA